MPKMKYHDEATDQWVALDAKNADAITDGVNTITPQQVVDLQTGLNNHTSNGDIHFTSTERTKLSGIAANANNYTLPNATTTTLGGVKVGTNLSVTTGTISVANASTTTKGVVQLNDTLTSTSTTLASTANQAKVLSNKIDVLTDNLNTHEIKKASTTELGHVKVDGTTITIDGTGTIKGANTYELPIATTSVLGGIKVDGVTITVDQNGVISSTNAKPNPLIYGVKIDTTNSNPETALTYTDDAVGFTPAKGNNGAFNYGSWEDKFPFNQIKPCLVNNGSVVNYLNPNDYSKFANGSNADITSGDAGDVMIEFPKLYWKFETVSTDLFIRYSDTRVDNSYKPLAHTKGAIEKDFVYISAYMGNTVSSKLRSLSGKTPTVSQTIGTFRTQAKANGTNYDQVAYYQLLMLQVLFIVMFKDRDSQTALGRGYVDGNSASMSTGGTNTKGLFYGETTGKLQNKFCGIEDFWGNVYYWIDGLFSDASRNILIGNQNFNDTGSGYINYGQGATTNIGGYISSIQGGTESGFIVKAAIGSATTHFSDGGGLYASCLPCFGGSWAGADGAGAFGLRVSYSASNASSSVGARLLAY